MSSRAVLTVLAGATAICVLTGCAASPDRRTEIPGNLQGALFFGCQQESGALGSIAADLSAPIKIDFSPQGVTWHVHVEKGQLTALPGSVGESPSVSGLPVPDPSQPVVAEALQSAQQLYNCFSQYRFAAAAPPLTKQGKLVMLYRWTVSVLWPCLKQHGFDPGPPPSRADFRTLVSALQVDPYLSPRFGKQPVSSLANASRYCAEVPDYLVSQGSHS